MYHQPTRSYRDWETAPEKVVQGVAAQAAANAATAPQISAARPQMDPNKRISIARQQLRKLTKDKPQVAINENSIVAGKDLEIAQATKNVPAIKEFYESNIRPLQDQFDQAYSVLSQDETSAEAQANYDEANKKLIAAQRELGKMVSMQGGVKSRGLYGFKEAGITASRFLRTDAFEEDIQSGTAAMAPLNAAKAELQAAIQAKPQTSYERMMAGRRQQYQSEKLARRQAFLSRFRPEVRENMMTKEEKAARDKAQTQATAIASTVQENQGQTRTTPEQLDPIRQELASPSGGESQTQAQNRRLNPYANGDPELSAQMDATGARRHPFAQRLNANGPTVTGGSTGLPSGGPTGDGGFQIQLDPNAQTLVTSLQETFGTFNTYIDKLATVAATIPSQIELTGSYVLDVQISGAAAFEALDKRMKELAIALVEPKLNALRDEVSSATGGTVKSSASMGSRSGDSASQSSE